MLWSVLVGLDQSFLVGGFVGYDNDNDDDYDNDECLGSLIDTLVINVIINVITYPDTTRILGTGWTFVLVANLATTIDLVQSQDDDNNNND